MPHITANSISLYYELHGPENSPVLVLNNGILMNATTSWVYQTRTLSRRLRLLQYDCRGQGQSDHPEGKYSMELHTNDLAELLKALQIRRAHIAGISYGGEVAQAFALLYPQMTLSLVLADTVSEVRPELQAAIRAWIDPARRQDAGAFFNATLPWNFSPEFIAANPVLLADARRRYEQLDYPAVVRMCECFLEVDFTSRLRKIKSPACIIVGEKDLLKGPVYARILKNGLPQAELHILPGAGHASCWERPEEFNTVVLGFLAKQVQEPV
jgi:3-oxoadipate enol-lactonase